MRRVESLYKHTQSPLMIIIKNSYSSSLWFNFKIVYLNGTEHQFGNEYGLLADPETINTKVLYGISSDIKEVIIQSYDCPGIYKTVERNDIDGLPIYEENVEEELQKNDSLIIYSILNFDDFEELGESEYYTKPKYSPYRTIRFDVDNKEAYPVKIENVMFTCYDENGMEILKNGQEIYNGVTVERSPFMCPCYQSISGQLHCSCIVTGEWGIDNCTVGELVDVIKENASSSLKCLSPGKGATTSCPETCEIYEGNKLIKIGPVSTILALTYVTFNWNGSEKATLSCKFSIDSDSGSYSKDLRFHFLI